MTVTKPDALSSEAALTLLNWVASVHYRWRPVRPGQQVLYVDEENTVRHIVRELSGWSGVERGAAALDVDDVWSISYFPSMGYFRVVMYGYPDAYDPDPGIAFWKAYQRRSMLLDPTQTQEEVS